MDARIVEKIGDITREAVITPGGRLAAKYVIHTVGPVYGRHGGEEAGLLARCYENSIGLAPRDPGID